MLADRSYWRDPSFEPRRSATVTLLIVNAVLFLFQSINEVYYHPELDKFFALSKEGLLQGYVWQLVTFQFMHAGLFHLLCNSIAIYVFGRPVEYALGRVRFLKLYFSSGIFGGLLQIAASIILPNHMGGGVMGASAGAFGLVAAYATMFPEQSLTVLLAFIIPVTMRAKFLLAFSAALAVYGILIPFGGIAHAAHLGGMLTGIAFIRWGIDSQWRWADWFPWFRWKSPRTKVHARELVNAAPTSHSGWAKSRPAEDNELPSEEFISREVDPILDKISAHGIHSLTQKERAILEAARRKMSKR